MQSRPFCFLILLALTPLPISAAAQGRSPSSRSVGEFRITQIFVTLPEIELWVEARDGNDRHVAGLAGKQFRATVGTEWAQITSVTPSHLDTRGVAYTLLLDASLTMKGQPFSKTKEAARLLVGRLRSKDRMNVLRIGTGVREVIGFKSGSQQDKRRLLSAIDGIKLGSRKGETHLFAGLERAFNLLDRSNPEFPRRRVVILISDGKDEGSGATLDDVIRRATQKDALVPVMVVGFSRLKGRERIDSFGVLRRIAALTRGKEFIRQVRQPQDIVPAFRLLLDRLGEAYSVKISWKGPADKSERKVEIKLVTAGKNDARTVKMRGPVRLRKHAGAKPGKKQVRKPNGGTDQGSVTGEKQRHKPSEAAAWYRRWQVWGGVGLALLLIVLVILLLRSKKKSAAGIATAHLGTAESGSSASPVADEGPPSQQTLGAPGLDETHGTRSRAPGTKPIFMELVVVDGPGTLASTGKRIAVDSDGIKLGTSSDLVLSGDSKVSREHCLFRARAGRIVLEDLRSKNGTIHNGVRLEARQPIEDGDEILVGQTKLRFAIREDR